MRLEGTLDAFSLPDIFALLSMTKKTGGLHLRREGAHGVVWLATGSLTGGSSTVARQSLARRIVAAADVDAETVAAATDAARDQGVSLTAGLQRIDAVDEALLHDLAAEHVVDVVFDLLRWPDGDFSFVIDEVNPDEVGVSRPVDEVVEEARRRLEVWESARDTLPEPSTLLRLATLPETDVTLSRDQWSMLSLVNGRRSVADLAGLWGRGEYAAARCLGDLVAFGVVTDAAGAGTDTVLTRTRLIDGFEGIAPAVEDDELPPADDVTVEVVDFLEPSANDAYLGRDAISGEPFLDDDGDGDGTPVGEALDEDAEGEADAAVAAVSELRARSGRTSGHNPAQSSVRDLRSVTPARPEPFRPARTPEHPDGGVAAPATVGALAAASNPAPASHIERDPSVNKSLLLRLIAGVRGL